tara:strand:- start:388 stop:1086 length:699 start_codon:yes stop_codon:yes gene_type:complete
MRILIFIPARGGSKGIPGKNLAEINNKPLIQFTLDTAKQLMRLGGFQWTPFVSTDDLKIKSFCESQSFDNKYIRPSSISQDNSTVIDAVWDAYNWLKNNNKKLPDAVLLLQPTSPLRKLDCLIEAINILKSKRNTSVFSVTKMYEHPYECIKTSDYGWNYLEKSITSADRRQEYEQNYYFIDGNFYLASIYFLEKYNSFIEEGISIPYVLKNRIPLDIDEPEDLELARHLLS